ncbi:hypothetical protein CYMTET_25885 [Cymbomonas tetramitiformis]|uniref:TF-B3 domain-containing protein n=1 Tax=Cymbomonas tetramitiformis TaxID=36881 RepID=A0AAE0FUH2_9CHLO|nr:hypothetical protein CYMTET_25885 [Cymbomonas tetramitiformis]
MDEMNNKEICDYEAERNKRIQENRKRMVELGLMQTVTNFKALVQTPRRATVAVLQKPRPPRAAQEATRKSARVSKMEAPNYREIENAANLHTVDLRRAWTKECTPTDNNSDLDDPLIPRVPVTFRNASNDWPREREVLQRATPAERATLLNRGPAFVKLMLPSHVAGGYWLQAPFGIHEHLPVDSCQILLMCGSEEWEVVWLMPKKGMSGGWRGFAVDQRLVVGDALVFQKLEGCRVGVRIYRVAQLGSQAAAADAAFDDAEQATAALFAPTNPVESSEQKNLAEKMKSQENLNQGGSVLNTDGGTRRDWHLHSRIRDGRGHSHARLHGSLRSRASTDELKSMFTEYLQLAITHPEPASDRPLPSPAPVVEPLVPLTPPLQEPSSTAALLASGGITSASPPICNVGQELGSETAGAPRAAEQVAAAKRRRLHAHGPNSTGFLSRLEQQAEYERIVGRTASIAAPIKDTGTAAEMHAKERPVTLAKDESAVVEDEKAEAQEADASIAPQQPLPKTKNRRSSSQAKLTDGDHWKSMKRLVSCHDKKRPAGDGKRKYGKSDHQSEKMEGRQLIGRRVSCYWAAEKQWFSGVLDHFDAVTKEFTVLYDDGDRELGISLPDDTVKFLD